MENITTFNIMEEIIRGIEIVNPNIIETVANEEKNMTKEPINQNSSENE
jgi:hypothetical protein